MQSREFQTLASGSNIIVDVAQNLELPDSYRINVTLEDISTGSNNHPHQLSKINKFANEFNARIEEHSEESDSVSNEVSDQSLDENLEIEQDINQKTLSSLKKECQTNTGIEYIQNALAQDHQSPYLFKNG
jgi:DNA-directed RNA polymerase alpha subunit